MSLNGLDSHEVTQAHQAALAEAGGWFLLKYISRDTVDLLGRGNGGVTEARKVVEQYEEKSPLYGLAQYRRKKFILKYVPDGTSRLLQVRLAVQFQSVLDTFTPHDTVFSFTAAPELTESALGLSTILQTSSATGSKTSSSTSLRQQRLNEIVEDSEEPPSADVANATPTLPSPLPPQMEHNETEDVLPSTTRVQAILAKRKQDQDLESLDTAPHLPPVDVEAIQLEPAQSPKPELITPRASVPITDKELPAPPPEETQASPSKSNSVTQRPSIDFSLPQLESDSDDDTRRPMPKEYPQIRFSNHLSAAESSSISKWSDDVLASTSRSKQKRASRNYGDLQTRPKTSGNTDETGPSRRANLPTTVRVPNRSSGQSSRPASQQSTRSVPARFIPSQDLPPPLPSPAVITNHARLPSQGRPAPSQASSCTNETTGITPEKMRLMKALQMRKRNQLLTQRSNSAASASPNPLASIDSSQSTTSDLSTANSVPPSSASMNREPVSRGPELTSIYESQTTSPTSVVTASDNHSTKPSSFSDTSPKNGSQTSLSSETGSSTTPKAENEKAKSGETGSVGPKEAVQAPAAEPEQASEMKTSLKPSDEKSKGIRPLTYHCATADFLADIEEEDRGRPSSIAEDERPPSKAISPAKKSKKRYQFEGTITIPAPNADLSDESDDEAFMEELQNATVHEAKPMSVNRTPATPVLSKAPIRSNTLDPLQEPTSAKSDSSQSRIHMNKTSRSASNDSQLSTPDQRRTASRAGSTRSLSTALPQWPPQPTEPVPALPKQRPIIGASISKRVKTFEGLSQRDSAVPVASSKESASRSSSLSNMLKRASFLPHSHGEKTPEKSAPTNLPSPLRSEPDSVEQDSSSRPWVQRPGTGTEVYSPVHKGETVSVTARIVREPMKPKSAHGTSDTTGNMHMSPLIVEHETATGNTDLRPPFPRELTAQSVDSLVTSPTPSERRRFSLSSHRSNGQKLSPVENKSHRLSFTTHKKAQKAQSDSSSIADEKRQSRTSRMLKRLSGLGKSKGQRDSVIASPTREQAQPNILEEPVDAVGDAEPTENLDPSLTRHVVDIGEVNVQFAETLLWKRRFLRVDDQGFLIFAPPANDLSTRGKSRKIHLEDIHRPALPDLEREQMAWSILLDLKHGGTVSCACESKDAQKLVLKMLLDAHNAYHQLYG